MAVVVFCATAYSYGGMSDKWLRRFLAPCIASGFLALCNKDPMQLIKAPLLGIASSIGYGSDFVWLKIIKRAYVGLAFGLGASITDIVRKRWIVVGFTTILCTSAFIIYGVWNPVPARVEESLLGLIIYTMAIVPSIKE
jgi:Na+-transporting NADH:ubiquinone oxidoreductase subunit NqrD